MYTAHLPHPNLTTALLNAAKVPGHLPESSMDLLILACKRSIEECSDKAGVWIYNHMPAGAKDLLEAYHAGRHRHHELLPLAMKAPRPRGLHRVGLYRCLKFNSKGELEGTYTGLSEAGLRAMVKETSGAPCLAGMGKRFNKHFSEIRKGNSNELLLYPALKGAEELPEKSEELEEGKSYYVFVVLLTLEPGTDYTEEVSGPNRKIKLHVQFGNQLLTSYEQVKGLLGLCEGIMIAEGCNVRISHRALEYRAALKAAGVVDFGYTGYNRYWGFEPGPEEFHVRDPEGHRRQCQRAGRAYGEKVKSGKLPCNLAPYNAKNKAGSTGVRAHTDKAVVPKRRDYFENGKLEYVRGNTGNSDTGRLVSFGSSSLYITQACRQLDLDIGDFVRVWLCYDERKVGDDKWSIFIRSWDGRTAVPIEPTGEAALAYKRELVEWYERYGRSAIRSAPSTSRFRTAGHYGTSMSTITAKAAPTRVISPLEAKFSLADLLTGRGYREEDADCIIRPTSSSNTSNGTSNSGASSSKGKRPAPSDHSEGTAAKKAKKE